MVHYFLFCWGTSTFTSPFTLMPLYLTLSMLSKGTHVGVSHTACELPSLLVLSALKHPWKPIPAWRHEYDLNKMLHDTKGNVKCNGNLVLQQLHGKTPSFPLSIQWQCFLSRKENNKQKAHMEVQKISFRGRFLLLKQNRPTTTTSQKKSHMFYLPSTDLYI